MALILLPWSLKPPAAQNPKSPAHEEEIPLIQPPWLAIGIHRVSVLARQSQGVIHLQMNTQIEPVNIHKEPNRRRQHQYPDNHSKCNFLHKNRCPRSLKK